MVMNTWRAGRAEVWEICSHCVLNQVKCVSDDARGTYHFCICFFFINNVKVIDDNDGHVEGGEFSKTFPVWRLVGKAAKNDEEQHCGAFTISSTVRYLRATHFDLLCSEANQLLFTNWVSKFVDIFFICTKWKHLRLYSCNFGTFALNSGMT